MEREADPYWNLDLALGEGRIQGEPFTIRATVHTAQERYGGRDELISLTHTTGQRLYIQARPYILVPDVTLTAAIYNQPTPGGEIGQVVGSEWEGMAHREIGQAQAWGYPADRAAVLWECFLYDWCREDDSTKDPTLTSVWQGMERLLLAQLPGLERIVTPSWEDLYEPAAWQAFLRAQGYQPLSKRAFVKEISSG